MENESVELQVWDWLKRLSGWSFSGSEHEKEFWPSVGVIPGALALVIGEQKIYFATGQVKEADDAQRSGKFSIDATFVAEKGLYRVTGVVGRGSTFDSPIVTWHPLSVITSMQIETSKSWWSQSSHYSLSVTLETSSAGTISLELPWLDQDARDELVATVQFLQGAGVARS